MSLPIDIEPRCTIKQWLGDGQIAVKVKTSQTKKTYVVDIKRAAALHPELSEMEAVKRAALKRFKEPDPLSFTGYE